MSTFFATQNVRNPEKIGLPRLGPINERQAPVQLSSDGWTVTHASASVPPEIVFPCGAGEQIGDAAAQFQRLPPVSNLIAEVEAGQIHRTVRIANLPLLPGPPKPTAFPRVVIDCQSIVSRNLPGFPLYEVRNWGTVRPAFNVLHGITEFEVERRLAAVHPPVIGFYLLGYNHLNLAMALGRRHNCRTIPDLILHVGAICERFVTGHCNDFRGPNGIRVGPGHAPLECVRMIRVVQVTDNYWVGVLSVIAHLKRS